MLAFPLAGEPGVLGPAADTTTEIVDQVSFVISATAMVPLHVVGVPVQGKQSSCQPCIHLQVERQSTHMA